MSNGHKNITQVFCGSTSDNHINEHVGEVTVKKINFQLRVQQQTMRLLSECRIEVTSLRHSSSIQSGLLTLFKASITGKGLLGKKVEEK